MNYTVLVLALGVFLKRVSHADSSSITTSMSTTGVDGSSTEKEDSAPNTPTTHRTLLVVTRATAENYHGTLRSTSRETEESKAPPQSPNNQTAPKAPKTPKTPKAPKTPKTPKTPKAPKTPKVTKSPSPKSTDEQQKCKKASDQSSEEEGNSNDEIAVAVPTSSASEADVTRCLIALQMSGFDLTDGTRYDEWFNETSVMTVADTGVFVGPNGIQEYVEMAMAPVEEYVFKSTVGDLTTSQVLPITVEGNECSILTSSKTTFSTYQLSSPIVSITGQRFTYSILEDTPYPTRLHMKRVDIYVPKDALGVVVGGTYGEEFATRLCERMRETCPHTFTANGYDTTGGVEVCIEDMLSLPPDEYGRIDGKSFGCRVVHAYLAKKDDRHCPHISFIPEYDSSCEIKCQKSKEMTNEKLFHPVELAFLAQHAEALGLGEKQWIA